MAKPVTKAKVVPIERVAPTSTAVSQARELLSEARSIVEVARALSSKRGIEAIENVAMEEHSLSDVLHLGYRKILEAEELLNPHAGVSHD